MSKKVSRVVISIILVTKTPGKKECCEGWLSLGDRAKKDLKLFLLVFFICIEAGLDLLPEKPGKFPLK